MPLNGSGSYSAPANSWNPAVSGTTINSTDWAALLADLSTALSTALYKDGQQIPTANIPMGGFKLTGLAAGTGAGNSVRYEQVLLLTGGTMAGDLLFTDATYDIGKSGATRPRDGFFSRNVSIGGHATLEGVTSTGATGSGKLVFDTSPTLVTPALGTPASGTLTNCTGLPVSGLSNFTKVTNALSADVNLNNTANFFDGPSVAQGTSGTWWASGQVTVSSTSAATSLQAKLWDGTTVIASGRVEIPGANQRAIIPLSGYLASPAANIRISVKDSGTTGGVIYANVSGIGNSDSTLSVLRIA